MESQLTINTNSHSTMYEENLPSIFQDLQQDREKNCLKKLFKILPESLRTENFDNLPTETRQNVHDFLHEFKYATYRGSIDGENAKKIKENFDKIYSYFDNENNGELIPDTPEEIDFSDLKNSKFLQKQQAKNLPLDAKLKGKDDVIFQKLLENRKNSIKDTYIVFGQLDSTTNEAIDSITFFKWLIANNIPAKYVLWKISPIVEKLEKEGFSNFLIKLDGNGISDCEFLHKCFNDLVRAKAIVFENVAIHPMLRRCLLEHHIGELVFLQHGPSYLNLKFRGAFSFATLINVCCKTEQEILENSVLKYRGKISQSFIIGGLPRWDLLKDESKEHPDDKVIFVMPTWRPDFDENPEYFLHSAYYARLKKLFSSQNIERLKKLGLRFVFAPHHHITNFLKELNFEFPVEISDSQKISYWIRHSLCCITDYSSVSFDFHFLNKPVIYWIHDADDFICCERTRAKVPIALSDIEKNNFILAKTSSDVIAQIEHYAARNFELESSIKKHIEKWFANKKNICEKIYLGIEDFIKKNDLKKQVAPKKSPIKFPKIFIRIACFFIWNKSVRKNWREQHIDLTPTDGIDIHTLSPEKLHARKKEKQQHCWYRKILNALVPATRAKIQHSERHILEAISKQNAQLRKEIQELREEQKALKEKFEKKEK